MRGRQDGEAGVMENMAISDDRVWNQCQSVESRVANPLAFAGSSDVDSKMEGPVDDQTNNLDRVTDVVGESRLFDGTFRSVGNDSECGVVETLRENESTSGDYGIFSSFPKSGCKNTSPVIDEVIPCPGVEGMDSDVFNEQFCFSVEELQAAVDSSDNHHNAIPDPLDDSDIIALKMEDNEVGHLEQGVNTCGLTFPLTSSHQSVEDGIVANGPYDLGNNNTEGTEFKNCSRSSLKNRIMLLDSLNNEDPDKIAACVSAQVVPQWHEHMKLREQLDISEDVFQENNHHSHSGGNQEMPTDCAAQVPEDNEHEEVSNEDALVNEKDELKVSDLVWGKVRSHPWWPGQIFDVSDASESAMKHWKKDCFLVAYFGDKTFAWNEASLLKPFRSNFTQIEKQSNSESFQTAVNSALNEVSRRVELGLTCSCVMQSSKKKYPTAENTGIRAEVVVRKVSDSFSDVNSFDAKKLVQYIKTLALSPTEGAERLDLTIAKSQLFSFSRLQGFSKLPEYLDFEDGDVLQFEEETSSSQRSSYRKRKHSSKDESFATRGEKLVSESWDSFGDEVDFGASSCKKQKTPDELTVSSVHKPSFKIGECIQRAAIQMTSSPSLPKTNTQKLDRSDTIAERDRKSYGSLLSQLLNAAERPYTRYQVSTDVITFFKEFRNSVILNEQDKGGRSKELPYIGTSPEAFEFDDMSDTYWTDRVIQNGAENRPRRGRKRKNQAVKSASKSADSVDKNAPAELVMHFPVVDSVPSETNLNRMFRRFGPLKESDTEVDRDTNRARVVFKKSADAEAAYSSASKFNIFGKTLVNYQLNYSISVPFRSPAVVASFGYEDVALFLNY